ncbi:hypothetical protein M407DRAFT_45415, partial [Tulasnella calospora MUT 4182]
INLQHNCSRSRCVDLIQTPVQQEREQSLETQSKIQHQPTGTFIVNTNSLHNYRLICAVTPLHL